VGETWEWIWIIRQGRKRRRIKMLLRKMTNASWTLESLVINMQAWRNKETAKLSPDTDPETLEQR
jgi:hypothetical protein